MTKESENYCNDEIVKELQDKACKELENVPFNSDFDPEAIMDQVAEESYREQNMKYAKFEKVDGKDQLIVVTREEIIRLVGYEEADQYIYDNGYKDYSDETFNNYQQATAQTAKYPPKMALVYLSLGIASEAGEVAGKMKKWIRDGDSKMTREEWVQAMSSEIGDVLWYAARLADELGLSLSQIAEDNMDKLLDRKARGVIGGSGDNR